MKRDRKVQLDILHQLEKENGPTMRFEEFSKNYGGYDDAITPDWSQDQAYNIRLLISDGLIKSERVNDAPWFGPAPDDPYAETYISITTAGHNFIEASNWFLRAYKNVKSNVATIVMSVLIVIIGAWLRAKTGI